MSQDETLRVSGGASRKKDLSLQPGTQELVILSSTRELERDRRERPGDRDSARCLLLGLPVLISWRI